TLSQMLCSAFCSLQNHSGPDLRNKSSPPGASPFCSVNGSILAQPRRVTLAMPYSALLSSPFGKNISVYPKYNRVYV
ncbi:MAG TPA: hypothetical protein VKS24_18320, partial [Bradyrhizobium sp.]|nr:hypothetical protein [Bradyrhizobium sp.]